MGKVTTLAHSIMCVRELLIRIVSGEGEVGGRGTAESGPTEEGAEEERCSGSQDKGEGGSKGIGLHLYTYT